jgi:hypothetical protein
LAHTAISHVADPAAFLREAIRLARPAGQIILHDGDYASLTFDTNTPDLDLKMPDFAAAPGVIEHRHCNASQ